MKYSKIKVKELLSGDLGNVSTDENYKNLLFNKNVSNNLLLEDICFENCMFDNIDFGNIKLVNVSFVNCYLKNCDLSNQVFDKQFFSKVDFENCKLMGVSLIDTFLKNISFKDCNCQYINLFESKINNFVIENSIFCDSCFSEAEFKNVVFKEVNFSNSEFLRVYLNKIDFTDSNISGIAIDLNSLKGMIINMYQCKIIADIFGVEVSD